MLEFKYNFKEFMKESPKSEAKTTEVNEITVTKEESSKIINVDLHTKSDRLSSILSFFKGPIFISLLIVIIASGLLAFFIIKSQVPELPQAGPKEKAVGQLSNPKVTVMSYEDLECSACQAYNPTYEQLVTKYKDKSVKFVIRHYPLDDVHPNPQQAAEASEYANDYGKFEEYKNKLFENLTSSAISIDKFVQYGTDLGLNGDEMRTRLLGHMYKTRVRDERALGDKTGKITGTPSVFVNDVYVKTPNNSVPTLDEVSALIDQGLK